MTDAELGGGEDECIDVFAAGEWRSHRPFMNAKFFAPGTRTEIDSIGR